MADPQPVPITFGEWRPDMAAHMSPALVEATNVLPLAEAYAPFSDHAAIIGTALPYPATGFFTTVLSNGDPAVFASTRDTIYRIGNGSLTTLYSGSPIVAARWWFAQVGGKLCAGCEGLAPVGGEVGAAMSPLGGSPPYAAVGAVVDRDFLVLGNLQNEAVDGAVPNRVRWSGRLNPDSWGTSVATGADFEDMHDEGGPVVQITGRSVGLVFQRRAITRMQPTGNASTVFAFTTLEIGRGAVTAGAVCDVGPYVFYKADDGFCVHDGTQSVPIGAGRVDDWFAANAEPTKIDLMRSGYDPVHRCVHWAFTEVGQTTNSAILVYSIADQRFTLIRKAMQEIGSAATLPASLESMPTPDLGGLSWDDPTYAGRRPILAGINSANTYGTFSGATLGSTITTGDVQAAPGRRAFISGIRPLVDAAGVQVAVGIKNEATKDAVAWKTATGLGVDGVCPQRADGRYHRAKQTTVAGETWTRSIGLELELQDAGER
jgi:hypothetical protein